MGASDDGDGAVGTFSVTSFRNLDVSVVLGCGENAFGGMLFVVFALKVAK